MTDKSVYLFGEVLFDCFPGQPPVLGGAPLNVAWHLQGFGMTPYLVTAVGSDALGQQLRDKMTAWDLSLEHVQTHSDYPTGVVNVTFEHGEPRYEIAAPAAWDGIDKARVPTPNNAIFYHGTLATRHETSREALAALLTCSQDDRVIDVNLRSPHWERERVLSALQYGLLAKLSIDELNTLTDNPERPWADRALELKQALNIINLLVTQGADGATLFDANGNRFDTPKDARLVGEVNSTVGAGDAFTAIVIMGMLNEWRWEHIIERAHQFAGYIVTQQGAVIEDPSIYQDFINLWNI
jgi:fructokinase